jgi:ribonuclease HI
VERPGSRKILLTLAETLSVDETCRELGLDKNELRDILRKMAGKPEKASGAPDTDRLQLFIDGASRGNPGLSGAGIVITKGGKILEGLAQYLGERTNNQAEYEALIMGLERLKELRVRSVEVMSDSELLVNQVNGKYRVKNPELLKLYKRAKILIREFHEFSIKHISRRENREADRLANRAIDEFTEPE